MGINEKLTDEELKGVSGGAVGTNPAFEAKRTEFNEAWDALNMEQNGFSGMKRAELFDEWQTTGANTSAVSFLSKAIR